MIRTLLAIAFVGQILFNKASNSISNNIVVELGKASVANLATLTFRLPIIITNKSFAPIFFSSIEGNIEYQGTAIANFASLESTYIQPKTMQEIVVTFQPNVADLITALSSGLSLGVRVNYTIMFGNIPYTSYSDISIGILVE